MISSQLLNTTLVVTDPDGDTVRRARDLVIGAALRADNRYNYLQEKSRQLPPLAELAAMLATANCDDKSAPS